MSDPQTPSPAGSDDPADETTRVAPPSPADLIRANAGRILGDMLGEGIAGTEREGDSVGPYRLCEVIGEGGFGNVWRAEQTEVVRREVALKVVKLGMDTAQVLGRFNQERQALASLKHPHIATMLDAGVGPNGRPYFAMELVRGGSITRWCAEHDATLEARLRLFIQVCQAVQHAHEKGILHRDIKPTNVLVTEVDGAPAPKVIDFGIAKAIHSDRLPDLTLLTHADQVIGTPVYMSPEQIEGGRRLDARSDVYALGALLYEMLTGEQAFDATRAGGIAAVKQLILETVPERPSTRVRQRAASQNPRRAGFQTRLSALPADLDWITMRALEKDRLRRYQTAAEFAADVQRHLDSLPVLARPPSLTYRAGRWLRRHRRGVALASVGAAAATAFILGALHLQDEARRPRRITLSPGEIHTNSLGMKFTPVPGTDVLFCIHETRNKDFAAYAAEVPGAVGLWMTGVATGLDPVVEDRDNHPVMRINWEEATAFCQWLSAREGRTYRLPSDREWSIAAGIGDQEAWGPGTTPKSVFKAPGIYPWEGGWPPPPGAGNYCDESRKAASPGTASFIPGYTDGFATTAPVMRFKPGKLGLYDMGGNVSEWVLDWYEPASNIRVLRGSGWGSSETENQRETLLSSFRLIRDYSGTMKSPTYGFRCVLAAAPAADLPAEAAPQIAAAKPHPALAGAVALAPAAFPAPLPPAVVQARSVTNSLGMTFTPVPGMAALFCRHETRRQDYAAYASLHDTAPGFSMAWKLQHRAGWPAGAQDEHPVVGVSWQDAQDFCAWLSRQENRLYRLPTDREWSIAAGLGEVEAESGTPEMLGRAGRTEFPWGDTFPPDSSWRAGNYADRAFLAAIPQMSIVPGYTDGFVTTAPVMTFKPNPFGIHDLGGNVGEWCEDWLNETRTYRVLRGSGWVDDNSSVLLSAKRRSMPPGGRNFQIGFRCVLVPDGAPPALTGREFPATPLQPPAPQPFPAAISRLQARQPPAFPASLAPAEALAQALTNSLGMKLLPVPGTSVLFCIHETRLQDYAAFAAENPQGNTDWRTPPPQAGPPKARPGAHPVTFVSWLDAQAFCAWLSRRESRAYRLPTDREWSLAAGIGHLEIWEENTTPQTAFKPQGFHPWGAVWPPPQNIANLSDESRRRLAPEPAAKYLGDYDDRHATTAPVMSYPPNKLGLHDLGGNVSEWCQDPFDHDRRHFPTRGSAWSTSDGIYSQTSFRFPVPYHVRRHSNGFRIVLEP